MGNDVDREWSTLRRALAWSVHFFTAWGLILAAFMAMHILRVDEPDGGAHVRWVFILMMLATLVDAFDGTFARMVRIKEVLPNFDGRRLDDLIDFLNFTCLPLLLIWKLNLLPAGLEFWLLFALLASAYGFCQVEAKTEDGYFLGFPSYWNLVAFYLYVMQPVPPVISLALVILLAVLTFIPLRYLYPTQTGKLNLYSNLLSGVWVLVLIWLITLLPSSRLSTGSSAWDLRHRVALGSLFFPIFYFIASGVVNWQHWKRGRDSQLASATYSKE